jgi:hypothetical protein
MSMAPSIWIVNFVAVYAEPQARGACCPLDADPRQRRAGD